MKPISEKKIKEKVKKLLKKYNVFYFMPAASVYGKSGIPDFVCCINGVFVGIETKTSNKGEKGLTALQKRTRDEITAHKGAYIVVFDAGTFANLDALIWQLACDKTLVSPPWLI
jgi:hypothetical protein